MVCKREAVSLQELRQATMQCHQMLSMDVVVVVVTELLMAWLSMLLLIMITLHHLSFGPHKR